MKILIYGAGVQGSYLAHILYRSGNQVDVLARNSRYDELYEQGIRLNHYLQRKQTEDRITVISALSREAYYDFIFVTAKFSDLTEIIEDVKVNISKNIVLVGNNIDTHKWEHDILQYDSSKKILFAFQLTGGKRMNGDINVLRFLKGRMLIGSLSNHQKEINILKNSINPRLYSIKVESAMEEWLLTHAVNIVTMTALQEIHASNVNDLVKDKHGWKLVAKAQIDLYKMLERSGYQIKPALQKNLVRSPTLFTIGMSLLYRMPLLGMMQSTVEETKELFDSFEMKRQQSSMELKHFSELRSIFNNRVLPSTYMANASVEG